MKPTIRKFMLLIGVFALFSIYPVFSAFTLEGIPEKVGNSKIIFFEGGDSPYDNFTIKNFLRIFSANENGFLSKAYDSSYNYDEKDGLFVWVFPKEKEEPSTAYRFKSIDDNHVLLAGWFDFGTNKETTEPLGIMMGFSLLFIEAVSNQ